MSTGGSSLRAIPAAERRWLAVTSAVLLLLTLVPLVVAAARTPRGQVFSGFVYEARDGNSYVAKTIGGGQGPGLYHAAQQHPETSRRRPSLALGRLDRLLHLPVPLLLQLVRLGLAAALLVAIYILCAECFADAGRRRLAVLLAVLGGGLGFLGIAHASVFGYHYITLDIGVSGSSGLDSLNLSPHVVLVCLGSTWAAILWLRHGRDPHPARLAGGLAWILVVSSIYPQVAAMWAVVGVLAWALRPTPARLAMAAAWVVAAVPYVAYGLYLRGTNPVFADWPPAADVDVGDPPTF